MVHQPSGGARGQATDILIQVAFFKTTKLYNTAFPTCPLGSLIDKIVEGYHDTLFQAEEITNLKKQLNLIYVKHTGQELQTIHDSLERDKFMNPQQALEFGLIDKVLEHPPKAGAEADKKE